jgi:phosphoribosylamine--glycine ligase
VLVTRSLADAEADIAAKLSGDAFGDAGRRVVIEEGLTGPECSLLVLCDGQRLAPLAPAQDFKRLGDADQGPNTGGMGAYSPVSFVDAAMVDRLVDEAVAPLVAVLRARGIDYRGVLYAGLMLTPDGPKVLEFNVRFGDPEAQVVLPRLDGDLAGLLAEVADGSLRTEPRFLPDAAVCVVLASDGYPEAPRTGDAIAGLHEAGSMDGVTVFHAGTALPHGGRSGGSGAGREGADTHGVETVVTSGGRVLGVTALAGTIEGARRRAYRGVSAISWPGMQFRSDIALAAAGGEAVEPRPSGPVASAGVVS